MYLQVFHPHDRVTTPPEYSHVDVIPNKLKEPGTYFFYEKTEEGHKLIKEVLVSKNKRDRL